MPDLLDLPIELLTIIFDYLRSFHPKHTCNAMRTCRMLHSLPVPDRRLELGRAPRDYILEMDTLAERLTNHEEEGHRITALRFDIHDDDPEILGSILALTPKLSSLELVHHLKRTPEWSIPTTHIIADVLESGKALTGLTTFTHCAVPPTSDLVLDMDLLLELPALKKIDLHFANTTRSNFLYDSFPTVKLPATSSVVSITLRNTWWSPETLSIMIGCCEMLQHVGWDPTRTWAIEEYRTLSRALENHARSIETLSFSGKSHEDGLHGFPHLNQFAKLGKIRVNHHFIDRLFGDGPRDLEVLYKPKRLRIDFLEAFEPNPRQRVFEEIYRLLSKIDGMGNSTGKYVQTVDVSFCAALYKLAKRNIWDDAITATTTRGQDMGVDLNWLSEEKPMVRNGKFIVWERGSRGLDPAIVPRQRFECPGIKGAWTCTHVRETVFWVPEDSEATDSVTEV